MVKIDEVDRKILRILSNDARASYTDIAKRVYLTPATVRKRVERMLEEKIIERFTTVLNPHKTGRGVAALITLQRTHSHPLSKIFDLVNGLPDVEEAYYMGGKCGVVMRVAHSNLEELYKFVKDLEDRREILSVECCVLLKKVR